MATSRTHLYTFRGKTGVLLKASSTHKLQDALEVYDPNTGHTTRYETVIPRNAALYSSTSANEKLSKVWISDASVEEIADDRPAMSVPASELGVDCIGIDDDDEYCDIAELVFFFS